MVTKGYDTHTRRPYRCPTHGAKLVPRPPTHQTYEQKYCGKWYDCPRCHHSVLEMSPALMAVYAAAAESAFQEGRRARLAGKRLKDDPWRGLSFSSFHWQRGFNSVKGGVGRRGTQKKGHRRRPA